MSDLADKKCIPCEGGIPSFNLEEIHKYLKKVDGWDVESLDKKDYYIVKNFKYALKAIFRNSKFTCIVSYRDLCYSCTIKM